MPFLLSNQLIQSTEGYQQILFEYEFMCCNVTTLPSICNETFPTEINTENKTSCGILTTHIYRQMSNVKTVPNKNKTSAECGHICIVQPSFSLELQTLTLTFSTQHWHTS